MIRCIGRWFSLALASAGLVFVVGWLLLGPATDRGRLAEPVRSGNADSHEAVQRLPTTSELAGTRESVADDHERLIEVLLFDVAGAPSAAKDILRLQSVNLVEPGHINSRILARLEADVVLPKPLLSNSQLVLLVLFTNGRVLRAQLLGSKYLQFDAHQANHESTLGALRAFASESADEDWFRIVDVWSEKTPKDLADYLRRMFLVAPRTFGILACQLLRDGIIRQAQAHLRVIGDVLIELGDPEAVTPAMLQAFGEAQAAAGGGMLDSTALLTAQLMAHGMMQSDARSSKNWLNAVTRTAEVLPQDPGTDMLTALVAAERRGSPQAIATLQRLLYRPAAPYMSDMILVNLGRVADAQTVIAAAGNLGISLDLVPVTERDIVLQDGLAIALLNALRLRPQDDGPIARQFVGLLRNWGSEPRCHLRLEYLIDGLGSTEMPLLTALLRALCSSDSSRVAEAAKRALIRWRMQ
jgi:hypothetical protein